MLELARVEKIKSEWKHGRDGLCAQDRAARLPRCCRRVEASRARRGRSSPLHGQQVSGVRVFASPERSLKYPAEEDDVFAATDDELLGALQLTGKDRSKRGQFRPENEPAAVGSGGSSQEVSMAHGGEGGWRAGS